MGFCLPLGYEERTWANCPCNSLCQSTCMCSWSAKRYRQTDRRHAISIPRFAL